jgi:branched-chain amino acid transport system substrate-binding protein
VRKKLLTGLLCSLTLCANPLLAENIKIGIAGPLTGPYAAFGEQLLKGATMAVEKINAQGGVNGSKIELIKADDACEPKQAVTAANRLVNDDEVVAVIGHFCSSSTLPAARVYNDAQIVMITPASTNPEITDKGYKTIFRTCGRDDQQGVVAADFINRELKAKNVAVIHDKDTYGQGLAKATKAELERLGSHIVLYEGLTRGEKDFNAIITKIKEKKADAIYFGGLHPEAGPLVRQLREQGSKVPFISGDGIVSEDFVTTAGGPTMVKGVYMTFGSDPRKTPESKQIVDEFRKNSYEPEGYTLYTYAAVQAIAEAISKTKSTDGLKLADWLHKNKVHTIIGDKQWDQKGDLTTADYVIYEWDAKGHYEPIK